MSRPVDETMDVHDLPMMSSDNRMHDLSRGCWCGPDVYVFHHKATRNQGNERLRAVAVAAQALLDAFGAPTEVEFGEDGYAAAAVESAKREMVAADALRTSLGLLEGTAE